MTKELIISANVHEKKVSIIEDGLVTEFYVERRDENQGVVGNLYKGRVMKVLPGMQSAFVDIGLERDAFLYVSDFTEFMEEEEEIDFKDVGEDARGPAARDERSRRPERPQRPAVAAGAPLRSPERIVDDAAADANVRFEDVVEQLAEILDESVIPPPPSEEELDSAAALGVTNVDGEVADAEVAFVDVITEEPGEESAAEAISEEEEKPRRGRGRRTVKAVAKKADKADEAEAAEPGKRKGRVPVAKRPSRRRGGEVVEGAAPSSLAEEESPFQRVTDEDLVQDAGEMLKDAMVQERIIDQVHDAEYHTSAVNLEPLSQAPPALEPEPEWRVGTFRSQIETSAGFQRVEDETADSPGPVEARSQASAPEPIQFDGPTEPEERSVSPFRHIADFLPRGLFRRSQPEVGSSDTSATEVELAKPGTEPAEEVSIEDADASIRYRPERGEFAVRRGGRGRRRRGGSSSQAQAPAPAEGEEEKAPEGTSPVEAIAEGNEGAPEMEAHRPEVETRRPEPRAESRPEPRPRNAVRGGGRRPEGRFDRRPDSRRPEPPQGRRPDRMGPATISDLLHEGQEILVQIAKEPIAKKGARITSHIALPGRYLVYMPTVNHIGVSRKIASEIERVRLKRTVTALRDRESASGGFIARTACAGHSEQELHDDMRYLIRTWGDVRKKAERSKSPSLVHRDLDLVQRILRDQLSDQYSAIRVDNEVEYARIVEFVNRVQPKLVNRVKLYTGGQPIFEKYGVQPEIDKAVKPRVWLRSGGYIVINQTEAL
ncbi:MAG TPA: ribonuclease E/G, partial [Blastocatellia bacterium]|nr:ribonuclease E/G [Blastocatellia bacterium]